MGGEPSEMIRRRRGGRSEMMMRRRWEGSQGKW